MGFWSAKSDKISSAVEYCPPLVFFGLFTIFNFSNKIKPSCLGEAILNSSPDFLKIVCLESYEY